jgi:hypothetical protein
VGDVSLEALEVEMRGEVGSRRLTASMPSLLDQGTQRGKAAMRSLPSSTCLDSQASMRGVSKSVFRLIPSSSWPASMRILCEKAG